MSTSTPLPRSTSGEENVPQSNGSAPRVKVTRSMPGLGSTRTRLFKAKGTSLLLSDFFQVLKFQVWRRVLLETVIMFMWVFASIIITCNSITWGTDLPGRTILVGCTLHVVMFTVYFLAVTTRPSATQRQMIPVHLNPAITFLLMIGGVQGPIYSLVLISAQCVGAILAALAAKEIIPHDRRNDYLLAGCYHKRTYHTNGVATTEGFLDHEAFLAEFIFSFTFLYVTILLVHRKQVKLLGVRLVPLLVAINIGFNLYLSTGLRLGYSGSMFNPARCLGSAVAHGQPLWDRLWIPFLAPFVAATAVAVLTAVAPPDHAEVYARKQDVFSKVRRALTDKREVDDLESQSPQLHGEDSTVYEVPSAARRMSESPQTPDQRQPPSL